MKKNYLYILLFILTGLNAQKKSINIDDIWDGVFRPDYLYGLKAMPQSDKYSKIEINKNDRSFEIGIYDYATQEKVATAFSTKDYPEMGYFEYEFSPDESKIIIGTKIEPIYRHSRKGAYYIYDRIKKRLSRIDDGQIQEPHFSPKSDKVAYVKDNNLFIKYLRNNSIEQITADGKKNHILNGIPDWVYEEEFGYSCAFEWNKDGQKLAYVKFDESEVPQFSMIRYGEDLYPDVETFKYPKAGEKNSKVSLHIYYLDSKKTENIDLGEYEYLPRIQWTKNPNYLIAITLNRHQNHLKIYLYSTFAKKKAVLTERKSETYIDLEATDNLTFLPNGNFIWSSEENGWNHLYLYDLRGKKIRQITSGDWEVTDFYGYDDILKRVFYQSTETGSINRAIYSIDLKGKNKQRLSPETGTASAEFSANHKYFITTYSSVKIPYTFTVNLGENGKAIDTIIDNKALLKKLNAYQLPEKVFTTFKAADGTDLNGYMIEPPKHNEKMPVLIYQYNGPNVQTVRNTWNSSNDYFHYLLAQKGYLIVSVDTRGTGGKGAAFKKSTYKQLGKLELEDITAVAKDLASVAYIDAERIGIWGWSFGGYMSSNAILKRGDIFKMAIAVAPVTNWRFYDTVYTERYMQTPQENPSGYDDNSPLSFTGKLKGKFLLIHGSADDNVHLQNTMRLAKKLQENGMDFDMMIYTDKNHGIYGKKTRHQLYRKMLQFIEKSL
jgi:dipeptidyl-peptidase-4